MTARNKTVSVLVLLLLLAAVPTVVWAQAQDASTTTRNNSIASEDIISQTISSTDIAEDEVGNSELRASSVSQSIVAPDAVGRSELTQAVEDDIAEALEPDLNGLEADAPYPGSTQLADIGDPGSQGENSTATWPADGGAALHEAWVDCADGKVATGGGYAVQGGADDASNATADVMIVTNMFRGDAIAGDAAGSVQPTGWVVRGKNLGASAITMRPVVVCVAND